MKSQQGYFSIVLLVLIFSVSVSTQEVTSEEISPTEVPDNSSQTKEKSFWESFWAGFWLIVVSEIGDKTFFLTMIYAATNSVMKTLIVSSICMLLLNFSSLLIGYAIPFLIYRSTLDWIAIIIFTIFGINLLYEGISEESVVIEQELNELKEEVIYSKSRDGTMSNKIFSGDVENRNLKENLIPKELPEKEGKLVTQSALAFSGTIILAEIGDRSQITTIVIAAVYDFYGVLLGTSIAHVLTIILAIYCGNILAKHLTTREILVLGGIMFLIFALIYILQKMALL